MVGTQDMVAIRVVDQLLFALRRIAPQHEDFGLRQRCDMPDKGIGNALPSLAGMRGRFTCLDGQYGVQQQYALPGPSGQVVRRAFRRVRVFATQLGKHIAQAGRAPACVGNRKCQPLGLVGAVVRVLAQNHDFYVGRLQQFQCMQRVCRENAGTVTDPL